MPLQSPGQVEFKQDQENLLNGYAGVRNNLVDGDRCCTKSLDHAAALAVTRRGIVRACPGLFGTFRADWLAYQRANGFEDIRS